MAWCLIKYRDDFTFTFYIGQGVRLLQLKVGLRLQENVCLSNVTYANGICFNLREYFISCTIFKTFLFSFYDEITQVNIFRRPLEYS